MTDVDKNNLRYEKWSRPETTLVELSRFRYEDADYDTYLVAFIDKDIDDDNMFEFESYDSGYILHVTDAMMARLFEAWQEKMRYKDECIAELIRYYKSTLDALGGKE